MSLNLTTGLTDMTASHRASNYAIIPRTQLDFDLDGDIPRHWFGGDVFKTRFFDAMSLLFPEGERYFIECVRDYRDQISDPVLAAKVKDFIKQEGQHGMQHTRYNQRLANQGIAVERIEEYNKKFLHLLRSRFSAKTTLAHTACVEHITATMAHGFMHQRSLFAAADPRMRALYVWHGVEEIEHKAVAFDVMQRIAKVGYFRRTAVLMWESVMFPYSVFQIMNHMFDVDGVKNRKRLWLKGLLWLYGPGGLYPPLAKHYLAWFKPGFHPWDTGDMENYERWQQAYQRSGDPMVASDALLLDDLPLQEAA